MAIVPNDTLIEIFDHMEEAETIYGDFTSTHEAMGVALEEWDELKDAVRNNYLESIRDEAIDLAAVLIRLANQIRGKNTAFKSRSKK